MIGEASFLSSSILINSSARQLELIAKASFASCFIVKQNCCWKIVVRRMQGVRSIITTNLYAEDREGFLSAYDVPMTFHIHFCLTIKYPDGWLSRLPIILVVCIAPCLSFVCLSASCQPCFLGVTRLAFTNKTSNMPHHTQGLHRL